MKYVRLLAGCMLAMIVVSCAKLPEAEIDMARAAVIALDTKRDVAVFAKDAQLTAWRALDDMNAELTTQARKIAFLRNYKKAKDLAAEVVQLAQAAADSIPVIDRRWINAEEGLKLRSEPTTKAAVLALIPFRQEVEVVLEAETDETIGGVTGRWTRVRWQGKEAWVFGGYLSTGAPEALPAEK